MKVTLVGTGCGSMYTMTAGAVKAIREAELIIGSSRLLESIPREWEGHRVAAISAEEMADRIVEYRDAHHEEEPGSVCVVFRGDSGFYSGAGPLLPLLEEYEIDYEILPGVSSVQMLSSRIGKPWHDWKLISARGQDPDVGSCVSGDSPTFFLTGEALGPAEICARLVEAGKGDARVVIGERLSYEDEVIAEGIAFEFTGGDFDNLSVMLVEPVAGEPKREQEADAAYRESVAETAENEPAVDMTDRADSDGDDEEPGGELNREKDDEPENESRNFRPGLPDYLFIRGDVPMTRRDVRAVIAGHMQIMDDDVIWDIGAGTGSVTCEMAIQASKGKVYAVETDRDGVDLVSQNAERFGLDNIEIVYGEAPDALDDLPAPDRVFIGGSGGNMAGIIDVILEKNPLAFVCVSAILLETATETMAIMEARGMKTEITQVSISTGRSASGKHMMIAGNPIFVITGSLR